MKFIGSLLICLSLGSGAIADVSTAGFVNFTIIGPVLFTSSGGTQYRSLVGEQQNGTLISADVSCHSSRWFGPSDSLTIQIPDVGYLVAVYKSEAECSRPVQYLYGATVTKPVVISGDLVTQRLLGIK